MKIKTSALLVCVVLTLINVQAVYAASDVKIPFRYGKGMLLYNEKCSSCHGIKLGGTDKGPPLVHNFYKPSHHGDSAFYKAALKGVRAHHWNFGDMPPVNGITRNKMDSIIPYIRYYQQQMKLY